VAWLDATEVAWLDATEVACALHVRLAGTVRPREALENRHHAIGAMRWFLPCSAWLGRARRLRGQRVL